MSDKTSEELVRELRDRGLYVLAFNIEDVKSYEMEEGPVEMTDLEAGSILRSAGKMMDNVLMEDAWECISSAISQFQKDKAKNT